MSSLFISDLHLEDSRPQAMQWLASFLSGPARQAEAVYILGDLFEYWIGDDAAPPAALEIARLTRELGVAGVTCPRTTSNTRPSAGSRALSPGRPRC